MKKKIVFLISFLLLVSHSTGSLAMEFDMLDNVDIHGFISQGYLKSNYNNFLANFQVMNPSVEFAPGNPDYDKMPLLVLGEGSNIL